MSDVDLVKVILGWLIGMGIGMLFIHLWEGGYVKEFYGKWKYSKKKGAWLWKWKKRKVKK